MDIANNYLGVGLKFPIELTDGFPSLVSDSDLLTQSIRNILFTPIGECFFNREFGSRLNEIIFEQNDTVTAVLIRQFVKEAIDRWEKRVSFVDAVIINDLDSASISVTVSILNSNEIRSFIYPFYEKIIY